MPPRSRVAATPSKKLKQKKLDVFLSSSPTASSPRRTSPSRAKRSKTTRTLITHHDNGEDGPSRMSIDRESSQSSDPGAIRFEPQVIDISDSGEDEAPQPTPSRHRTRYGKKSSRVVIDESDSDDEVDIVHARKGKRVMRRTSILDSDEEGGARPRKKSKLVKGKRPHTPEQEGDDLLEEVDQKRIIESRLRNRDKRSEFQRNLDKLKRKKRGEAVESEESSVSEREDLGRSVATPFSHARPNTAAGDHDEVSDEEEEEEDTFIVEDDGGQVVELPAEFSMGTYQDLLHHFKIVCQLFVHMAVHDVDEREGVARTLQSQQYFSVPLKITRRKLSGMRDSLVAGSTWKPRFKKALDKYPDWEQYFLDFTIPGCDACNLGSRKSTIQGRLSGEPYDTLTYEPIADDSSESSDDDEESKKPKKQFDLGRFCAKRTRTYHKFTHWEYHLFHALREEVDQLRATRSGRSFVQVAYAKGKQPPEDLTDADGIMEWLDERQVINLQWHEIKMMMDDARHLEVRGSRRDDADSD